MLDRMQVLKELEIQTVSMANIRNFQYEQARMLWQRYSGSQDLIHALERYQHRINVPVWHGNVCDSVAVEPLSEYEIIAVDGSQIYPDRHRGIDCFLLNIGVIKINYGLHISSVDIDSRPYIFMGSDAFSFFNKPEYINAKRAELELSTGLSWIKNSQQSPTLFTCDGPLCYTQLPQTLYEQQFVQGQIAILDDFYRHSMCIAGYVSLPHSRDLVHCVRVAAELEGVSCEFEYLFDGDIAGFFLQPGQRSTFFAYNTPASLLYPEHLRPYFFYLHTGAEISKIEIPAWIVHDAEKILLVTRIVYDQVQKGYGYPIALAEAHEAAVVTAADTEFFATWLYQYAGSQKVQTESQKYYKKRHKTI